MNGKRKNEKARNEKFSGGERKAKGDRGVRKQERGKAKGKRESKSGSDRERVEKEKSGA